LHGVILFSFFVQGREIGATTPMCAERKAHTLLFLGLVTLIKKAEAFLLSPDASSQSVYLLA